MHISVPFTYDVNQTREKFKRCMAECKKASLTMKTASGIKRFQENKGYGKRFNCLLPFVQSRVSCQPEQALDPSSVIKKRNLSSSSTECPMSEGCSSRSVSPGFADEAVEEVSHESGNNEKETFGNETAPAQTSKNKQQMFVPVKRRKSSKLTEFEETVKKTTRKSY